MADVHTPEIRSFNMSQIKNKNTKPELLLRKSLLSYGFRYLLHKKDLPGKPDIVLPDYNTVIFVHGCFWHGHNGCKYFVVPKTRTEWWTDKIKKTQKKDKAVKIVLKKTGRKVMTVWECELRPKNVEKTILKIVSQIDKSRL